MNDICLIAYFLQNTQYYYSACTCDKDASVFFGISHVISHFYSECSVLLTPSPGVFRCVNFVLGAHLAFVAFTAIVYTSGIVLTH